MLVATRGGTLHCLSGKDGKQRWQQQHAGPLELAHAGKQVALLDGKGQLSWRDVATGKQLDDGRVVAPGRLRALGKGLLVAAPGRLIQVDGWTADTGLERETEPATGDVNGDGVPDVVLAGRTGGRWEIVAVDGKSGRVLWRKDAGGQVSAAPAIDGGRVAFGTWGRRFDLHPRPEGGSWPRATTGWTVAAARMFRPRKGAGRWVAFGTTDREVYLAPEQGEDGWTFREAAECSVLRAHDLDGDGATELIAAFRDGTLVALRTDEPPPPPAREATDESPLPAELIFGVPRYMNEALMQREYRALMDYLSSRLGVKCTLRVLDYSKLIDHLAARDCHIGALSPLAYVLARRRVKGLKLIASHVAGGSAYFRGCIIVRDDSALYRLDQLAGRKFAFVDPDSTSGALYPQALLLTRGLSPKTVLARRVFGQTHDRVVEMVLKGEADAGAIYEGAWEHARHAGRRVEGLRIIAYTEPIPYDAYVAIQGVPRSVIDKLRRALLRLDSRSAEGRKILGHVLRIDRWIPPDDRRYDGVRRVLRLLERAKVR